ncbi:MAG: hypothetical protein V1717_03355, partial [Candidatus Micrarchaeota archaeon]
LLTDLLETEEKSIIYKWFERTGRKWVLPLQMTYLYKRLKNPEHSKRHLEMSKTSKSVLIAELLGEHDKQFRTVLLQEEEKMKERFMRYVKENERKPKKDIKPFKS